MRLSEVDFLFFVETAIEQLDTVDHPEIPKLIKYIAFYSALHRTGLDDDQSDPDTIRALAFAQKKLDEYLDEYIKITNEALS